MAEKKGLFDTLKGALFEEAPDVAPAARPATVPPAPLPAAYSPPPVAQVDPNALAKLEGMLKAATPSVYTTFLEKVAELQDVIPDETMRFKAALKTSHTTVEELSAAIDQLFGAMDKAHNEFTKAFESNKTNAMSTAQQQIAATESTIATREGQIKAIQDEIASLRSKNATDTQHMHDEDRRFEGIRQGFEAAHTQILSRLNTQKSRIATMPKG